MRMPFLRLTAVLFAANAALLLVLGGLASRSSPVDELRAFILHSEHCDALPCFLGVVPGRTEATRIGAYLDTSGFVAAYNLVDTRMQFRRVDWEWNGTQPEFLRRAGVVLIQDGLAEAVVLAPDVTLAQAWQAFGEPHSVGGTFSTLLLRYPQQGFWLETQPDCRRPWASAVEIHIRARMDEATSATTLDDRLQEICGAARWP